MIPEDRRKLGLVFTQNTKSNISVTNLKNVSKNQVIDSQNYNWSTTDIGPQKETRKVRISHLKCIET